MVEKGKTYRIQPREGGAIHLAHVDFVEFDALGFFVHWHEEGGVMQCTTLTSFERWQRPGLEPVAPDPGPRDPVTDPQRGDMVRTWLGNVRVFARDGDRVALDTSAGLLGWTVAEWSADVEEVITVGGAS